MMEFGDLKDDKDIQLKVTNFHNSLENIEKLVDFTLAVNFYEKLTTEEKVNYDLFMDYMVNTLFWLYLRTKGIDPNKNEVKNQLNRVKEYMLKAKEAHDRNTIRPTLNQAVAERFIRHGIEMPEKSNSQALPNKGRKKNNKRFRKSFNEPESKRKK